MKRFLLACLLPTLLFAQDMQLTEQLGKTVLYGDIAVSPDGAHLAWVQSTAATNTKQLYLSATTDNAASTLVNLGSTSDRTDADPAFSPDSKSVVVFSAEIKQDQRQLWKLNADGSSPQKIGDLHGYAARP